MKKRLFILILLMCSVVLGSLTTFTEVVDIQNKNTELLNAEEEKPIISDEIQSKVEETLNGFTGGFVENKGQKNEAIHYYTESIQMAVGFGTSELHFNIFYPRSERLKSVGFEENLLNEHNIGCTSINLTFLGSNDVIPIVYTPTGVYCHYFKGSDPTKWVINNKYYTRLIYHNIYEQIDLLYELKQGQLKYEFIVYPGGKLEDIQLHWTGPVSLKLLEQGMQVQIHQVSNAEDNLVPVYNFVDTSPIIYQSFARDQPFKGSFELLGSNIYGFSVPSYDSTKVLIIDPLLTYSTYLGGSIDDYGLGIVIDDAGHAYVTGYTYSTDFPTTLNAYNATGDDSPGYRDIFVCKLSSDGSNLLYSTYVSGSQDEVGYDITVDDTGNAYVTGYTLSTDFPTVNPYMGKGSIHDVIVFKLAANGSSLLYSTYLSGNSAERGLGIAVDGSGNAYITGYTRSSDFPTENAYDNTYNGGTPYGDDVFVTKLNGTGNGLVSSTFLGGSADETGNDITIDSHGNTYVCGSTQSSNFPIHNAYNSTFGGGTDVFVTKFDATGSGLIFSTYLGGSEDDTGADLVLDSTDNAYVTGSTKSIDFPTVNAYDATGDGNTNTQDVYVCKLAANGSSLVYSTYVSGSDDDQGRGIAVDTTGHAYVTGRTESTNFPTTVNAYNATGDGSTSSADVFACALAFDGSSLLYSTYVSGSGNDESNGIAVDAVGNAYVTGSTNSFDFPTVNAYNATGDGDYIFWDAFICKLMFRPSSPPQLSAAISADLKVILVWGAPILDGNAPVTAYRVYRSTTSGVYGSFLAEATSETFIDSTAVSGVEYFYVVTALNFVGIGESFFSNEVTITVSIPITVPSAPQSLSAISGDNFVYLSWSAPSSDGGSAITRYRVYRGTSSGDYFFLGITTSTNFNDTTALGGTTYYYVVTAVNTVGESNFSNEVSTIPSGSPPDPVITTITTTVTTTVTSFTSSSGTTPTTSPGFEMIGLVIAFTGLMITMAIYRRRKNA